MSSDRKMDAKRIALIVGVVGIKAFWPRGSNVPTEAARSNSTENSPAGKDGEDLGNDQRGRWTRRLALIFCLLATGIAVVVFLLHYTLAAEVILLGSAVLATMFISSPERPQDLWVYGPLALLGLGQAGILISVAERGIVSATSPAALFRFVIFGLAGACVAGIAFVKSAGPSKIAEPVGLLVAAVSLMAVCLPGLISSTQPLGIPPVSGNGDLFVADPHNQAVALRVWMFGIDHPYSEAIQISTTGHRRVRWVFAVSGNAQMIGLTDSGNVGVRTISFPSDDIAGFIGRKVQLFSGYVSNVSPASIIGTPIGTFASFSSDRVAVAMPLFEIGVPGAGQSSTAMADIANLLGAAPIVPSHSEVNVLVGPVNPSETMTGSIPFPPTPTKVGSLEWSTVQGSPIGYTLLNQDLLDLTDTTLFLLAFLLGVSGAGLFAGLQAWIHLYSENRHASP